MVLCASASALVALRTSRAALPALFALAVALSGLNAARPPSPLTHLATAVPRCDVIGHVLESHGGLGTLVALDRLTCEHADAQGLTGVVVVNELGTDPGSPIRARGWLIPLGSHPFDRARARLGAAAELDIAAHEAGPPTNVIHRTSAFLRASLRDATAGVPERRAGLLRGLAIGDTELINDETEQSFRRSGLSHLVAVSGSNVAIVVGAVALAAGRAGLRLRVGLSFVALALYVAVVGPDPSVLRAAAMGSMVLIALASGRTTEPLAALGVAVIVCVGLRPPLASAPGLHLSVAATAGIVIGSARLKERFTALPRALAAVLSVGLAAQLAVAPILVATFGELSLVAPLANVVAIPAVAPATVLTLLAGLIEPLTPQLVAPLMLVAEACARWILITADLFGDLPFASVALPRWTAVVAVPWLGVVLCRAIRLVTMSDFHWRTLDANGKEIARSEIFDSKAAAEAWMGSEWESLVDQGGESVSLYSDGDELYNMGLGPA